MPRSGVTIRDVAARAGVSHQTVSRVLNNSTEVTPETRDRVNAAIAELDYRPNANARSLAAGRTYALACLAPNLTDYTFASIIEGIESEARQHGYFVFSSSTPDADSFGLLAAELSSSRRADGLLIINPYNDARHTRLAPDFPVVLIGSHPAEPINSVSLDDRQAARAATRYLRSLGHRQIVNITGPQTEDCTRERIAGYQDALEAARIDPNPALILEGDWTASSGALVIQRLLKSACPFTAVFAQNDRMAIGAIHALRQAGRRVPEDISVIGFDDMPLASYFDPPLTTMRQDTLEIGREAVRLLIRTLENPGQPAEQKRLPADLIIRYSTQPL